MIIKLIGDKWVPEDKMILSVRDEENVKTYLPNIMKKLSIKRMDEYRLYFTSGERKCDYLRPIDVNSSWKNLGLSGGSTIYLSSKEDEIKTEEATTVVNSENTDDLIDLKRDSNQDLSTVRKEKLLDSPVQEMVQDNIFSHVLSDGTREIPLEPPMSHTSPHSAVAIEPSQVSQVEPHIFYRPELPVPKTIREDGRMTEVGLLPPQRTPMTLGTTDPKEEGHVSNVKVSLAAVDENNLLNPVPQGVRPPILPVVSSVELPLGVCNGEEDPLRRVTNINSTYHNVLATQKPPFCDVFQRKRGFERDAMHRRYERTAYIVSLYEFAHLELQRQRQRAAALREDAERGMICTQNIVPKPLYRI